jgi:hypothetical protein
MVETASTRETLVQPIWEHLEAITHLSSHFLLGYREVSYKCYSMDLENLPYILAVMYGNNTAPLTRLFWRSCDCIIPLKVSQDKTMLNMIR